MSKILPTAASLLLTEDCNLRCTYCFENHNKNKMSDEVALKSLQYLSDNAKSTGQGSFGITMFGGEPMLQPDLMEFIFKNGHEIAKEKGLHFGVTIITNATVMTDKIYRILSYWKNKVQLNVQLSVDGDQESQDLYRLTVAGQGSFHLVEKNVPIFKEIFSDMPSALNIHGVVNKKTLPKLYENYKKFRDDWDFQRIWFLILQSETEWSYEDVAIYEENLMAIADHQLDITRKEGTIKEIYNYAPIDKCLSNRNLSNSPCGAGKNFVTITADGDIYPCHHFYFNDPNKETKIGSLKDGIDEPSRKIFIMYDGTDLTCESDCPNSNCYRCIAQNWTDKGSMFSQIKGINCLFSGVEKKVQDYTRRELEKMGILNKNNKKNTSSNLDCTCDSRGGQVIEKGDPCLCNVRSGFESNTKEDNSKNSCSCGDKKESNNNNDGNDELLSALSKGFVRLVDEIEEIKKLLEK